MLVEEQAAELLRRCEALTGRRLKQIRGNLRKVETRAAAIWELLVLEEAGKLGKVQYEEPDSGGKPDILLTLSSGRGIWIEVAFLYPRFWKLEQQSEAVANWITEEASRRNISPFKVSCRFDGDIRNAAGPVRHLPLLHEKRQFLKGPEVTGFFDRINNSPDKSISIFHSSYSVGLTYAPAAVGPFLRTGGGLSQESPRTVKEHAVYRVLKEKTRQHKLSGPRLICIGSDHSPALCGLVGPGNPRVSDAVYAALSETASLAGVIVVSIKNSHDYLSGFQRRAKSEIFLNSHARETLSEDEIMQLRRLNFNRWKYFYAINKFRENKSDDFRRVGGSIEYSVGGPTMKLEIPTSLLIDSLAGKRNVIETAGVNDDDPLARYLRDGWTVASCSLKEGDIEAGESPRFVVVLKPPPERVFWPTKKAV